ncbi:MAG: DALR anticodon-binding domain-containing protein, partial [Liquorilactobacillus satsumensis]|uniref:DALR anticodon-binding domain-containing protein n=1 Tax=Liquorilactobacillus satsumensis TaxID=259059 RepID=UPI0039EB66BE
NLYIKDQVAEEGCVGAVIFHDLKNERMNNFDFNLEEVVRFEGETGPYVQYSHARAMSILRKAAAAGDKVALAGTYSLNDPDSWEVLSEIAAFPAMVKRAVNEYEPSVIAKYALHLAKAFNKYYAHTKVLQDDVQLGARLALVKSVATVLKESLNLLGVHAPDRM